MNTNSAFNGSYTENLSWYKQIDVRQIRIMRRGKPNVHFDAADNCCFYIRTMKEMSFQDDIPSKLIDNFKHHYVIVSDLT